MSLVSVLNPESTTEELPPLPSGLLRIFLPFPFPAEAPRGKVAFHEDGISSETLSVLCTTPPVDVVEVVVPVVPELSLG